MSGLLGDIFSYGDGLKRQLGAFLSDPGGTIDLGVQRFKDQQNTLSNALKDGYPMAGQNSVLVSPQQKAMAQSLLADQGAQQGIGAATVWHGSPHKFDKFDASKIGTGEGAQAYGHGLYMADSPAVAKSYSAIADNLAGTAIYRINGANLAENSPEATAVKALVSYGGDVEKARNNLVFGQRANASIGLSSNRYEKSQGLLDDIANKTYDVFHDYPERQLYKVDLPDEHIAKMLDWDKPLSQQAPEVQRAMTAIGPKNRSGQSMLEMDSRGEELVRALGGGDGASSLLRQAGIPGIRYLDGGSRGAGAGSSNYVVFPGNEGLLSILERNGAPQK